MKNLLKCAIFLLAISLSACEAGKGIEVSNPTPTAPSLPPKKMELSIAGFMNLKDLNGAPAHKLVFLKEKRIAVEVQEQAVVIQSYEKNNNVVKFTSVIPGHNSYDFLIDISPEFIISRFNVVENNETISLSYEDYLGNAATEITGQYRPFNEGTCYHFGKKIDFQQAESEITVKDLDSNYLFSGQIQDDGFFDFSGKIIGTNSESNLSCEGSLVDDQISGVCIPNESLAQACTFFLKKYPDI